MAKGDYKWRARHIQTGDYQSACGKHQMSLSWAAYKDNVTCRRCKASPLFAALPATGELESHTPGNPRKLIDLFA